MKNIFGKISGISLIVVCSIVVLLVHVGVSVVVLSTKPSSTTSSDTITPNDESSQEYDQGSGNGEGNSASDDTDSVEVADTDAQGSNNSEDGTSSTTATSTQQTTTSTTVVESPSAVVAFYSDNQSDGDGDDARHQKAVNYILATGANPIFHAGDVMEDGTQDSLDRFNAVTATLRASRSFYAALGNNDRTVGDPSTPSQLFLDNFSFPNNERWYSVNIGNLHMVVLDSAFAAGNPTQMSWLVNDLQSAASQSRITGVMYHYPTYTSTILQTLLDNGVDFVVAGHTHTYSHTNVGGIEQFVMSGQPNIGYMVARIYADTISITSYNHNNVIIESYEFDER